MDIRAKIYTTRNLTQADFTYIKTKLLGVEGIKSVTFDIAKYSPPVSIPTIVDRDGDTRPMWDWFDMKFNSGSKYNCDIFLFTPYYRSKWGISSRINASIYLARTDRIQFWLTGGNEESRYPGVSEFERQMLHEFHHAFCNLLDRPDDTHLLDYKLKKLTDGFVRMSFNDWNIYKKIVNLLTKFFYGIKNSSSS